MNRWHLREWKIVGLYALLYFFCVGLGVLVGTLFDRAGNILIADYHIRNRKSAVIAEFIPL